MGYIHIYIARIHLLGATPARQVGDELQRWSGTRIGERSEEKEARRKRARDRWTDEKRRGLGVVVGGASDFVQEQLAQHSTRAATLLIHSRHRRVQQLAAVLQR